jgi:choline kinase
MVRKAIILAAGMGTRLRPLTNKEHKCMTKVCGTPIIYQALSNLQKADFDEVVVVTGYLGEQVENHIKAFGLKMNIKFAKNDIYEKTNTIYSLKCGLTKLQDFDELYIIEGDVFFEENVLHRLIESESENATILEPYNSTLDGTFVELNNNKDVVDWCHKSDQPVDYVKADKFKTVNLHKFSSGTVENILKPLIDKYLICEHFSNPIEKLMRIMVNDNNKLIHGVILSGEKWFEIDDINDLKIAESIFGGSSNGRCSDGKLASNLE